MSSMFLLTDCSSESITSYVSTHHNGILDDIESQIRGLVSWSSSISRKAFCCDGPHSLAILDFRRSVVGFIVVDKTDNNRSIYLTIPMTLRISFIFVGAVGQSVGSMLFDHNCLFSLSSDSRILSSVIFKRVLCFWWAFHKPICHLWWPLCLRVHRVGLTSHVGKSSALTVSQT